MPKYLVEMHDGRKFQVEADAPPSEQEVLDHLGGTPAAATPTPAPKPASAFSMINDPIDKPVPSLREVGQRTVQALPALGAMAAMGPVGAGLRGVLMSGARSVLGAMGGSGAQQAIEQVASGQPKTAADVAGTMAQEGAITGGGNAAAAIVPTVAARGALRLMQSALKPTATLVKARTGAGFPSKEAVSQAVLDEGRIVSGGSANKAQAALDATDAAAQAALKQGAGAGVKVSTKPVSAAILEQARPAGTFGEQIDAAPDVGAIHDVNQSFLKNPNLPRITIRRPTTTTTNINTGVLDASGNPVMRQQSTTVMKPIKQVPQPMDAAQAHRFATNTGKNLQGQFARRGAAPVEAQKAGRAEITGQLRAKIPELEPLWEREARQITTRDALNDAMARTNNRDIFGLSGIAGAIKNPQLAAVALADRSALLKSMAAQGLNKAASSHIPTAALRAAIMARLAGKQEED